VCVLMFKLPRNKLQNIFCNKSMLSVVCSQHVVLCRCNITTKFVDGILHHFFRSTPKSRPNKVGLRCPYVRPSTKSFSDSDEIWDVGRGR